MIRFLILPFLFLFLTGCATTGSTETKIPAWITDPLKNTPEKLYGSGAGSSPDAAVVQALESITSQLYAAIKSSMNKNNHPIRLAGDETTRQEVLNFVKAYSKKFDFNTLHVEEAFHVDTEYIALISLDRKLLYTQQKMKLDTQISQIESTLSTVKTETSFEYFVQLYHAHKQHKSILAQMEILYAINNTFPPKRYQSFIDQIDRKYYALKQSLHIRLVGDANAIYFLTPIKNALNAEGMKVNNTQQKGDRVVTVLLSATSQHDEIQQYKTVKIRLDINVKKSNKSLASATHTLHGKSSDSYQKARVQAVGHLKNKIDSIGIFNVLGF